MPRTRGAHRAARRPWTARRRAAVATAVTAVLASGAVGIGIAMSSGTDTPTTTVAAPASTSAEETPALSSPVTETARATKKPAAPKKKAKTAKKAEKKAEKKEASAPAASQKLSDGTAFYNHPGPVHQWATAHAGDSRRSLISQKIASRPQAVWFATYQPATVTGEVRHITSAASKAGQVPVLALYAIPDRDCGGASAGGAPDLTSYDAWVEKFAAGLGRGPAVVIVEPDSLALIDCLSPAQLSGRYASLARVGRTIHAANPNAKVYLDAGHSAWNSATEQADRLRKAGVLAGSDGIYTNVSNFQRTQDEIAFAKKVLAQLGSPDTLGAVIDTSRNGNGPPAGGAWCDPSGRALGTPPTANTLDKAIDAYLWIKRPGEADGCAGAAGSFSPGYAYRLASG